MVVGRYLSTWTLREGSFFLSVSCRLVRILIMELQKRSTSKGKVKVGSPTLHLCLRPGGLCFLSLRNLG